MNFDIEVLFASITKNVYQLKGVIIYINRFNLFL